jgi:hypothetical protein
MWVVAGLLVSLLAAAPAIAAGSSAQIVNISATTSGCTSAAHACDNAADHLPPGATIRLISPKTLTLDAGTYRLSYAGPDGRYRGWRINREQQWVWNFGIAVNLGGGKGQLLYVAIASGIHPSLDALIASRDAIVAGRGGPNAKLPRISKSGGPTHYTDTLTLPAKTKLSFFVLDYDVTDNAGGVSIRLERLDDKR